MISVAIAALLLAILSAVLARSRSAAQSATCLSRLHSISQGFAQYITDNEGRYPDPFAMQRSWEQCIGSDMTNPLLFACPADGEVFPAIGSSYDWRDTGIPATTMAGRTAGDVIRPEAVLAFETLPGWHDKGKMNAVKLDGSACTMDQEHCLSDLQAPIRYSPTQ